MRTVLRAKDGMGFSFSFADTEQMLVHVFGAKELFEDGLWLGDEDIVSGAPFSLFVDYALL